MRCPSVQTIAILTVIQIAPCTWAIWSTLADWFFVVSWCAVSQYALYPRDKSTTISLTALHIDPSQATLALSRIKHWSLRSVTSTHTTLGLWIFRQIYSPKRRTASGDNGSLSQSCAFLYGYGCFHACQQLGDDLWHETIMFYDQWTWRRISYIVHWLFYKNLVRFIHLWGI